MTVGNGIIAYRFYTQDYIQLHGYVWQYSNLWSITLSCIFASITLVIDFFTLKMLYLDIRYYFFND